MQRIIEILLLAPPILLALTFHEYAHGLVAYRLGDPTAKNAGRLTLNPLVHLDPIGTIMLFIVHFGWAKPVPVDPRYFRNPRRDMVWVALAGPVANMVIAIICGLLLQFVVNTGMVKPYGFIFLMIAIAVYINLILAFFNLIPIPPLDGSKIVGGLLPVQYLDKWYAFERVGGFVLLGLIVFGMMTGIHFFGVIFLPTRLCYYLFTGGMPSPF